jgi:hypothetical protein
MLSWLATVFAELGRFFYPVPTLADPPPNHPERAEWTA